MDMAHSSDMFNRLPILHGVVITQKSRFWTYLICY